MIYILQPARLFKNELDTKLTEVWYDEKYKFYFGSYQEEIEIEDSNFHYIQFVSLDSNNEVIGFFNSALNRYSNLVSSLSIINFTDNKITFARDIYHFIDYLFEVQNFNKIEFTVIQGNPIETSYDRIIEKYNGSIVGIQKDKSLINGEYHNVKLYEIMREDYIKSKEDNYA